MHELPALTGWTLNTSNIQAWQWSVKLINQTRESGHDIEPDANKKPCNRMTEIIVEYPACCSKASLLGFKWRLNQFNSESIHHFHIGTLYQYDRCNTISCVYLHLICGAMSWVFNSMSTDSHFISVKYTHLRSGDDDLKQEKERNHHSTSWSLMKVRRQITTCENPAASKRTTCLLGLSLLPTPHSSPKVVGELL